MPGLIEHKPGHKSFQLTVMLFMLSVAALYQCASASAATLENIRLLRRDRVCELSFEFDRSAQYMVKRMGDSLVIIFLDAVSGIGKEKFELPGGTVYKEVNVRGKQKGNERLLGATVKLNPEFLDLTFNVVSSQPDVVSLITLQSGDQKAQLWTSGEGLLWEYDLLDAAEYDVDLKSIGERAKRDAEAQLAEGSIFNVNESNGKVKQKPAAAQMQKSEPVKAPPVSHEPLIVIADKVNYRSGMSAGSEVLGRLSLGEVVEYVNEEKGWIQFRRDGKNAWVSGRFVSDSSRVTQLQWNKIRSASIARDVAQVPEPENTALFEQEPDLPDAESVADSVSSTHVSGVSNVIRYTAFGRDPFMQLMPDSLSKNGRPFVENLKLVGILFDKLDKIALTEDMKNGKRPFALRENDPVEHGKVLKIYRDRVVFLITEYGISRSYTMRLTGTSQEQEVGIR